MPRVKVDYVISFSSEDAENPASSLLSGEVSRRKWLGSKGEASQSVVLQLAKSTKIQSITVGSYHSALVEVLVGRSEKPLDPFKVLVLSSIFMSPSESKKSENVSKVRTFQYDQLAADTRDQSWDRIRIVCLQPYNKHVKYGLSFVHIFEPESATSTHEPSSDNPMSVLYNSQRYKIAACSSDDEELFKPGELFAKINTSSQPSVDAQIRKASKPCSLNDSTESPARLSKIKLSGSHRKTANSDVSKEQPKVSRVRENLIYKDEAEPNDRIDKIIQRDREEKERSKEPAEGKIQNDHRKKDKENSRSSLSNDSKESGKGRKEDTPKHSSNSSQNHNDRHKNDKQSSHHRESTSKNKHSENSEKESSSSKEKDRRSDSDRKRDHRRNGESCSRHSMKRPQSGDEGTRRPKRLKAGPRTSSPHRLMADVVFVLSGYQNPRRAVLRDMALAMGAKYRQDWGDGCTHLICAFANTPKLRQVRSRDDRTAITTGEWIEECCRERRLLPWRWFATEPDYREKREALSSDEEGRGVAAVASDCDTDDEIQKVLDHQHPKLSPDKPKCEGSSNDKPKDEDSSNDKPKDEDSSNDKPKDEDSSNDKPKDEDSSNDKPKDVGSSNERKDEQKMDTSQDSDVGFVCDERIKENICISDSETDEYTDEEIVERVDFKIDEDRTLPDFFEGYTFAVDKDLENLGIACGLLKRYIIAYSGELVEHISEDSTVNYMISMNPDCPVRKEVKSVVIVKPDWIWRCHKKLRKVSSKDFIVK